MKKTKKILLCLICVISIIISITLVSFADVVDKGSYTFDTNTGKITCKEQAISMERYPYPIENGSVVHNGTFTTIGKEYNFQLDITLLSSDGSKTISFCFPYPDHTKNFSIEFGGGDFQVWLLPVLKNNDGSITYQLKTISYTNDGDFAYFYDDFPALIVERPTPSASQSISDYVVSLKDKQINQLNFDVRVAREDAHHYYEMYDEVSKELFKAEEALEQGNWFTAYFDGLANAVLTFINTIGAIEIGGISLLSVIGVVITIVILIFVIKVARA